MITSDDPLKGLWARGLQPRHLFCVYFFLFKPPHNVQPALVKVRKCCSPCGLSAHGESSLLLPPAWICLTERGSGFLHKSAPSVIWNAQQKLSHVWNTCLKYYTTVHKSFCKTQSEANSLRIGDAALRVALFTGLMHILSHTC